MNEPNPREGLLAEVGPFGASVRCPKCHTTLKRGLPRFGPAKVTCRNCGTLVHTGLVQWSDLSDKDRRKFAVREILTPYWIGHPLLILVPLLLWGACTCNVCGAIPEPGTRFPADILVVLIAVLSVPPVYLLFHIIRLRRMIRESDEYSRAGQAPVW